MSRKPGKMYREIKQHAYTRRKYMGGVPPSRITQFVLGNKTADFPVRLTLHSNERCQMRHSALESARIAANKTLEKFIGVNNYRLRIHVYPFHVLRENKQATGAGADRVSQGMRRSFGTNVGTAARVEVDQTIISIETSQDYIQFAKEALRKATSKLPSPCKVIVGDVS
jgi:large subunit ribosomal protein L10e